MRVACEIASGQFYRESEPTDLNEQIVNCRVCFVYVRPVHPQQFDGLVGVERTDRKMDGTEGRVPILPPSGDEYASGSGTRSETVEELLVLAAVED